MISCKDAGQLFYGFMDRVLDSEDIQRLDEHIKACEKCFGHLEFDKAFRALLQNQSSKLTLSQDAKAILREKLDELD